MVLIGCVMVFIVCVMVFIVAYRLCRDAYRLCRRAHRLCITNKTKIGRVSHRSTTVLVQFKHSKC